MANSVGPFFALAADDFLNVTHILEVKTDGAGGVNLTLANGTVVNVAGTTAAALVQQFLGIFPGF